MSIRRKNSKFRRNSVSHVNFRGTYVDIDIRRYRYRPDRHLGSRPHRALCDDREPGVEPEEHRRAHGEAVHDGEGVDPLAEVVKEVLGPVEVDQVHSVFGLDDVLGEFLVHYVETFYEIGSSGEAKLFSVVHAAYCQ